MRIGIKMSKKEQPQNIDSSSESKKITQKDLEVLVKKISIPQHWEKMEKTEDWAEQITPEYLQGLNMRIADNNPMSLDDWRRARDSLYGKISHSNQSEAQRFWELFLEKGIKSASHLVESTTTEDILEKANTEKNKARYKEQCERTATHIASKEYIDFIGTNNQRVVDYLENHSEMRFWHDKLLRMLAEDAGISNKQIIKLGKQMLENFSIPFEKKIIEFIPDKNRELASPGHFIEGVVRNIKVARYNIYNEPEDEDRLEKDIDKETKRIVDEIFVSNGK